jgi:hypothetical protein
MKYLIIIIVLAVTLCAECTDTGLMRGQDGSHVTFIVDGTAIADCSSWFDLEDPKP